MVLFPCFRSRSKIEDFTTTLSIPVTDLVECAAGLRPGGGQVIQSAFGQAARTQRESCRRPQGSAVWPSEGLNERVLVISPQSTLKRSHKAISKQSRGFFSAVVFFCVLVVDHVRQDITHYALSGSERLRRAQRLHVPPRRGPATLKR